MYPTIILNSKLNLLHKKSSAYATILASELFFVLVISNTIGMSGIADKA